jgi:hypothetical protein
MFAACPHRFVHLAVGVSPWECKHHLQLRIKLLAAKQTNKQE